MTYKDLSRDDRKILQNAYDNMISRCYRPCHRAYQHYQLKMHLSVCAEWLAHRHVFCDWALAHGWQRGLTLDRIDNTRGYSPDNCRWITFFEQQNNRSNNRRVRYAGATYTIAQLSRALHIPYATLYAHAIKYDDLAVWLPTRLGVAA